MTMPSSKSVSVNESSTSQATPTWTHREIWDREFLYPTKQTTDLIVNQLPTTSGLAIRWLMYHVHRCQKLSESVTGMDGTTSISKVDLAESRWESHEAIAKSLSNANNTVTARQVRYAEKVLKNADVITTITRQTKTNNRLRFVALSQKALLIAKSTLTDHPRMPIAVTQPTKGSGKVSRTGGKDKVRPRGKDKDCLTGGSDKDCLNVRQTLSQRPTNFVHEVSDHGNWKNNDDDDHARVRALTPPTPPEGAISQSSSIASLSSGQGPLSSDQPGRDEGSGGERARVKKAALRGKSARSIGAEIEHRMVDKAAGEYAPFDLLNDFYRDVASWSDLKYEKLKDILDTEVKGSVAQVVETSKMTWVEILKQLDELAEEDCRK